MSPNARALFQKDTWWDNNIRQISTDMKESAKPVHDNAPIISFVGACLSPSMRDWMGINLIKTLCESRAAVHVVEALDW